MTSDPVPASNATLARLQDIFKKIFGVDRGQITETTSMQNLLYWDSLNHLRLMLEVEKCFSVKFKPVQLAQMTSVERILECLPRSYDKPDHSQV